jgi:hypothetical protein
LHQLSQPTFLRKMSHNQANHSLDDLAATIGLSVTKDDPIYRSTKSTTTLETDDLPDGRFYDDEDFDDDDDDDDFNPEKNRATVSLHNNGLAKAGLVGGGSLLAIIVLMNFYKGAMPKQQAAKSNNPTEATKPTDPRTIELERAKQSESQSKAELALQKQKDALVGKKDQEGKDKKNEAKDKQAKPPAPVMVSRPESMPVARAMPIAPPPASAPEPIPLPPPPVPSPGLSSPPISPGLNQPTPTAAETDPQAEWQRLASLGRFGTVTPRVAQAQTVALTASHPPKSEVTTSKPQTTLASSAPPLSEYFQAPAKVNNARRLVTGSTAQASTVTPILWAPSGGASGGTSSGSNNAARFVVQLDEPMQDSRGGIALPAGTQLVVAARSGDANIGLVDLDVVAVIINGAEFAPPMGAMSIRDRQGGLLVGDDYQNRKAKVAGKDMMMIFASALGKVGGIMNQATTTSSSSINSGGSSSVVTSSTNPPPNYVGAALEGGFGKLAEVMSTRNQSAIQEIMKAPKVYQVKSGRTVQLFINQSIVI